MLDITVIIFWLNNILLMTVTKRLFIGKIIFKIYLINPVTSQT